MSEVAKVRAALKRRMAIGHETDAFRDAFVVHGLKVCEEVRVSVRSRGEIWAKFELVAAILRDAGLMEGR